MTSNSNAATSTQTTVVNGVDVDQVMGLIGSIEADEAFAAAQFRAKNQWSDGGLTRSRIKEFHAVCREDDTRTRAFVLDSDEPEFAAGRDSAPNAVEYILHALASCLTTTVVYHAAVQGIDIQSLESELEGDMDLRGLFGMSDTVRKGFHQVRVTMRVRSAASVEQLRELASFSPVFEMVSNSVPVDLVIEKY